METAHVRSCIELKEVLTAQGVDHNWALGSNESLVHRGRMEMMQRALDETNYQYLMWLDADIQFTPDDVGKLWQLVTDPGENVEIAVGVYPMKKPNQSWYAAWVNGELVKDLSQFDQPMKVDYAGTGFMLISRAALEGVRRYLQRRYDTAKTLRESLGRLPPNEAKVADEMLEAMSFEYEKDDGKKITAYFMTPIHNGGLESEDYNFCRIAKEAGFDVWMDPSVKLVHWGQWAYGEYEHLNLGDEHL